jgi:hypothetical protein
VGFKLSLFCSSSEKMGLSLTQLDWEYPRISDLVSSAIEIVAPSGSFALPIRFREGRQLCLFENPETANRLDALLWCHSFDRQESSLHTLAPYATKLNTSLVQVLIDLYSQPGEIVLDPFAGSGVVALEAALAERQAWANDANPYAAAIVRGKLAAPRSERAATQSMSDLLNQIEQTARTIGLDLVPEWIHDFFHPDTLREIGAAVQILQPQQPFLTACLLGILHHVLPGHLSYPCNQQAPYLRRGTYPAEQFPHLYAYRDVRSRLLAKVKRVYRHHGLPCNWEQRRYQVWQTSAMKLAIATESVDAIISQPPHSGAIESVRDQRLRLWWLGWQDWKALEAGLISSGKSYRTQLSTCLQELVRVLKPNRHCVFVLTDVQQHGKIRGTAELLADLAVTATERQFVVETIYDHCPPQRHRSQSSLKPMKFDRILVLRKRG